MNVKRNLLTIILSGVIVILGLGLIISSVNNNTHNEPTTQIDTFTNANETQVPIQRTSFLPGGENDNFVNAAEKTVNAVVHIRTEIIRQTNTYDDFFGAMLEQLYGNNYQQPSNKMVGFGSGVVLSPDGYIVTNNHVVDGADKIEVTFNNKHKKEAVVIGADPATDLALIKVDASDLEFLTFGNSDNVRIGEWVLAVGNPFNLTSTVTAGIVSAKARNINILGDNSTIESFIQTDAVVNRGNSGGALVNINGELIGINAAIASHTGVYEGYSFAIPSNIVKKVVDDFIKFGATQRAYLGIQFQEMTQELAEELHSDILSGVYVADVIENGAADKAGIVVGDIITEINNYKLNTGTELLGTITQFRPGDKVNVKLVRGKKIMDLVVTLTNEEGTLSVAKTGERFLNETWGVVLEPISKKEQQRLKIDKGLKIVEVKDGIFRRGGVNNDFVITRVNGVAVNSQESLDKAIAKGGSGKTRIDGLYPNGMKISFEFYE